MLRMKTILVGVCLVFAFAISATAQTKSLYDRLGGKPAITAVVGDFAGRVLADDRIKAKFAKTDAKRLTFELVEQICMVTGGPCKYTGKSMPDSHKNMKVTEGEFNALVEDLVATLDKFNVPAAEKNELLGILGPLKGQIVEVKGDATGTPLPKNFKPAPALKQADIDKANAADAKNEKKKP